MNGPWSLDQLLDHLDPVDAICRCDRCDKLHMGRGAGEQVAEDDRYRYVGEDLVSAALKPSFRAIGPPQYRCGPDFNSGNYCDGLVYPIDRPPQNALLAALRLGGERAVVELVYDGCEACVAGYAHGAICTKHRRELRHR